MYINEANVKKPLLAIFTVKDVEPHEELCFSYHGRHDDSDDSDEVKAVCTFPRILIDHETTLTFIQANNGNIYVECQCGAANCRKIMFQ